MHSELLPSQIIHHNLEMCEYFKDPEKVTTEKGEM